ncbi:MAG TPA: DUF5666 domain-containing protein [Pseudolabrys sp.]|nr:DUF5666 domain-containing protein [Pseudolabrys sp.]
MHRNLRSVFLAAALTVALGSIWQPSFAATNLRGTITAVNGNTLEIKRKSGDDVRVRLADNLAVAVVDKASPEDIKPGTFIGTAAAPSADGGLQALEVHIFPESMRGTGEGNRNWDLAPKSSMTNGAVKSAPNALTSKVDAVKGNKITVEYAGGSKDVAITPQTKVVKLAPGSRDQLKPNAEVFIPGATPQSDGTMEAKRITVGKDGVAPPM